MRTEFVYERGVSPPDLQHQIHESGSSNAESDVRSEQVGVQHHDGACAFDNRLNDINPVQFFI